MPLLLAACGRIGFDGHAPGDDATANDCIAAGTHDEDADGVVDNCDVCPHLAGPQLDGDGDRVGDACDPEPARPAQRIVVFEPFTSYDAWGAITIVQQRDDSVTLGAAGTQGSLRRAFIPGNDVLAIGARTSGAGTGPHLVAVILKELTTPAAYYCEVFDSGTDASLFFTYTFDNVNYMHPGQAGASRLAMADGTLALTLDAGTVRCKSTWSGNGFAQGGVPPNIDAMVLGLYAENVEAELFYFIQIRTEP